MKKILGFTVVLLFIVTGSIPLVVANQSPSHRGSFYAVLGVRASEEAQFELLGNFRDFRNRHMLYGTITPVDSERTFRFQGMASRNSFILQSAVSNRIVNIVGSFTSYDDETELFTGLWRGFIVGYGYSRGWIEASFT